MVFKFSLNVSFDTLKNQLISIPLLTYPDMNKPMILYFDANDLCFEACLTNLYPEKDGPVSGITEEIPIYLFHRQTPLQ